MNNMPDEENFMKANPEFSLACDILLKSPELASNVYHHLRRMGLDGTWAQVDTEKLERTADGFTQECSIFLRTAQNLAGY